MWENDAGMRGWQEFMASHMPGADRSDASYVYAYGVSKTLLQVLKQCGEDVSRENVMRQAANLHELEIPVLMPGIKVNTSPTNYHPIQAMRLIRWSGKTWEPFGDLIQVSEF